MAPKTKAKAIILGIAFLSTEIGIVGSSMVDTDSVKQKKDNTSPVAPDSVHVVPFLIP